MTSQDTCCICGTDVSDTGCQYCPACKIKILGEKEPPKLEWTPAPRTYKSKPGTGLTEEE